MKNGKRIDKSPKDGEGRRMSLDPVTCDLFREKFLRRRDLEQGAAVGRDVHAATRSRRDTDAGRDYTQCNRTRWYAAVYFAHADGISDCLQ